MLLKSQTFRVNGQIFSRANLRKQEERKYRLSMAPIKHSAANPARCKRLPLAPFIMTKSPFALLLLAFLLLASCEKEVHINMSSGTPQLVVNGQIDIGTTPTVVLTHSFGYFAKVDLTTLQNSFVHDAKVEVSNGSRSVRLREYEVDSGFAKFYYYGVDSADPDARTFVGAVENFYTLSIESGGRQYSSITKIPFPKAVDSFAAVPPNAEIPEAPTAMQLSVWYSDPDTFGNAIRYFTRRNSEPFYPGPNSVYDDQVVNGTPHARFFLAAGGPRNSIDPNDSAGYVFRGDTVTLRWAAIDRGVFNFYSTLEYSLGTVGNPFSTPINVMTNISGGALGVWAGYASTYYTIVVPK
jgi:hypothetical protein